MVSGYRGFRSSYVLGTAFVIPACVLVVGGAIAADADIRLGTKLRVEGTSPTDKLNLRSQASASSKALVQLPPNAANLEATGRAQLNGPDKWIEVRYGKVVGWVHSRFVAPVDSKKSAGAASTAKSTATIAKKEPRASDKEPTTSSQTNVPKVDASVSNDPIADCNSSDRDRKLRGCTALISQADLPSAARAVALSRRADGYLAVGDFERTVADLTEADKLQPSDELTRKRLSFAHYMRGLAHSKHKRHDQAIADCVDTVIT